MKKTYILALSLSLITGQLYAADSNTASPEPLITYNASVANSIDNIAEKLREFQDKNPNASEAELNEYIKNNKNKIENIGNVYWTCVSKNILRK